MKHQLTIEVDGEVIRRPTKEAAVRACMSRLLRRYDSLAPCPRFHINGGAQKHPQVRDWFKARHDTLRREFAEAINEDVSIIGKHWHYDYYVNHITYGWGSR